MRKMSWDGGEGSQGDSVETEEPLDSLSGSLSRGLVTTTPGPSVFLVSRLLICFMRTGVKVGKSPWLTVYSATGSH